ncbi:ATP-binding protein [Maribacter algarum]|uniref:ATP-binding protein n=1 Tax=Maribacter algarum (ex Zhang et al. 2020) TaxID=2578118 RepID=A0A5S3Q0K1_9FLAO|nr:AAA family ATPase [Maribacter algarum]TMM59107.1 ATP-binding protein [Maribacter algarum]
MYLKFVFHDSQMPNEFGDGGAESVYYSNDLRVFSNIDKEKLDFLGPYSKLNLFVGANNSGKSRFLRGLLKSEKGMFEISSSEQNIKSCIEKYQKWIDKEYSLLNSLNHLVATEVSKIMHEVNRMQDDYNKIVGNPDSYLPKLEEIISKEDLDISEIKKKTGGLMESSPIDSTRTRALFKKLELFDILKSFRDEIKFSTKNQVKNKLYIPILRSIKKSTKINERAFVETVVELYDLKEQMYKIFTGLDLFDQVLNIRNDLKEQRIGFERFESFLSKYFFGGKSVEIISHLQENVLRVYVDGEERKIHDIGDGIQSIILLLFPIFTAHTNTWIFIEEPETYLHPGLQRIFIETLINDDFLKTKNLRYFFTTHSNHLLDKSIESNEISIFQFEKKSKERFDIKTNVKPNKEVLDLLGVNASSVFLANTSLWVEGPTDRKYISKFLRLYCEHHENEYLKEDIDFAFFEYGGNLIAHYLFEEDEFEENPKEVREKINSFALSKKIYLLADSDNADMRTAKGKRRIELEKLSAESENFEYQSTVVREIENLLPKVTIKNYMKKLVKKEAEDKLKKIDFKQSDFEKVGIAKFYMDNFKEAGIPVSKQRKFKPDGKSETLNSTYKTGLCDFFLNSNISYEELILNNPKLDQILGNLYDFIEN